RTRTSLGRGEAELGNGATAHRGSSGKAGGGRAGRGRPAQGRVSGDAGPRAAQPPRSDPECAGVDENVRMPTGNRGGPRNCGTSVSANGPAGGRPARRFTHQPGQDSVGSGANAIGRRRGTGGQKREADLVVSQP